LIPTCLSGALIDDARCVRHRGADIPLDALLLVSKGESLNEGRMASALVRTLAALVASMSARPGAGGGACSTLSRRCPVIILRGEYKHHVFGRVVLDELIDPASLKAVLVRREVVGNAYAMHHSVMHAVEAEPDTVSLVIRGSAGDYLWGKVYEVTPSAHAPEGQE